MRSVVGTLEEMEVQMDGLEEKCRIMRRKLEEEEDEAQEVGIEWFHLTSQRRLDPGV